MGDAARPTDAELIHNHLAGDPEAFGGLVDRYTRLAGAIAYNVVGDYATAADVVQEAFLKVHGALADLREPEKFKGWFYGVVRACALDTLRYRRRRAATPLSAVEGQENIPGDPALARPGAGAERQELEAAVLRGIQDLPESYREVVLLKYIDERSYKEISELLGITVETIESRLFRARKLLKTKLAAFADADGESEVQAAKRSKR
jgi:RNA polymerase sigma-70 factor (ECF subfamily)